MDKERLLKLAEIIEKGQHKFNGITAGFNLNAWLTMRGDRPGESVEEFVHNAGLLGREDIKNPYACNTAACIAGFACLLFDYEETSGGIYSGSVEERARRHLSLTRGQASTLFTGFVHEKVTGPMAARVIRRLVETGYVNWLDVAKEVETLLLEEIQANA